VKLSRGQAAVILMGMNPDARRDFAERVAARTAELFSEAVDDALAQAVQQAFEELRAREGVAA
jgi:hypothetical protein